MTREKNTDRVTVTLTYENLDFIQKLKNEFLEKFDIKLTTSGIIQVALKKYQKKKEGKK